MIPRRQRPHHQHRVDRRPGRQLAGHARSLAYNTSKGAVVNFTRTLAGEWGKYGITVNAIAPGFFPSKMTKGTLEHDRRRRAGRARAAAAPRRRRRPEGRGAAVRLGRPASTSPGRSLPSTAASSARSSRRLSTALTPAPCRRSPCRHPVRRACSASSCIALRATGEAEIALDLARRAHQLLGRGARRRAR